MVQLAYRAGESACPAAEGMAAFAVFQLRRFTAGSAGRISQGRAARSGIVALGYLLTFDHSAPHLRQDSASAALVRTRTGRTIRWWRNREASRPQLRALGANDRGLCQLRRIHPKHRHRRIWKYFQPALHGPVESLV